MIEGYQNKAMKQATVNIKLNTPLAGKPSGFVVRVKTDKDGTPLDRYWRDRLKDAKTDNCCAVVQPEEKKIIPRKKTETDGGDK